MFKIKKPFKIAHYFLSLSILLRAECYIFQALPSCCKNWPQFVLVVK